MNSYLAELNKVLKKHLSYGIVMHSTKQYLPANDHDALQLYSNMLYAGSTVNICSLYIISVLTTTEVCYNVVLG